MTSYCMKIQKRKREEDINLHEIIVGVLRRRRLGDVVEGAREGDVVLLERDGGVVEVGEGERRGDVLAVQPVTVQILANCHGF